MSERSDPSRTPPRFRLVLTDVAAFTWRPELQVEEMPSPQRIAPYAVALSADVVLRDEDLGSGRLVILHDPDGVEAWEGDFRAVAYAKGKVDPDIVTDALVAEVGWSWLMDALTSHQASYLAPGGSVSSIWSQSFGALEDQPMTAEIEVRASWTPVLDGTGHGIVPHLQAFGDLLCQSSGLPPLPDGVVMMNPLRTLPAPGSKLNR